MNKKEQGHQGGSRVEQRGADEQVKAKKEEQGKVRGKREQWGAKWTRGAFGEKRKQFEAREGMGNKGSNGKQRAEEE